MSVERIAERMGLADHWSLYKWMQSGRIPANLIRPYELACGIDFVTRYLAASAGRLVIDMPTGRSATAEETQALQETLNCAAGALLKFYAGKADAQETLSAVKEGMAGLAWHHRNVEKHLEPELDFGGNDA